MINIGKTFLLGDSYSTFENQIPKGYLTWYLTKYPKERIDETDVNKLEQTWWYQFFHETKSELVRNCSYSGTTICNTGYDGADCSNKSFIARLDKLIEEGFFNKNRIDTFLLFGGTNDTWAGSPVGELMYSGWSRKDFFKVLPAFTYLLHQIRENISGARVLCMMNDELSEGIAEGFKEACAEYGVETIELHNIRKTFGHPNINGMMDIKNQFIKYLENG